MTEPYKTKILAQNKTGILSVTPFPRTGLEVEIDPSHGDSACIDLQPAESYELGKELIRAALKAGFQPPMPELPPLPTIKPDPPHGHPTPRGPSPVLHERGLDK